MPGFKAGAARLEELAGIAGLLGLGKVGKRAAAFAGKWTREIEGEEAFHKMIRGSFPPKRKDLALFLRKHGSTRYGIVAKTAFR